jgi:hypothetical protein
MATMGNKNSGEREVIMGYCKYCSNRETCPVLNKDECPIGRIWKGAEEKYKIAYDFKYLTNLICYDNKLADTNSTQPYYANTPYTN